MYMGSEFRDNILVIILAGGEGTRLMPLTTTRTKPAVPIGAKFRLIDIPLSNAANSGLHRSLVLTQGKDKSLNRHIKNTWFSDRQHYAFTEVISPQGVGKAYRGDADAVRQIVDDIKAVNPAYVLIVPGDHLLKMNYFKLVRFQAEMDADVAIALIKKPLDQARHFGSLKLDDREYIADFREKDPDTPFAFNDETTNEKVFFASMGIYAFKPDALFKSLEEEGDLFGKDIIPKILSSTKIAGYNYNKNNIIMDRKWVQVNGLMVEEYEKSSDSDYWRDVGTIGEYFNANMDLTGITPTFNLYGEKWPFFTCKSDLGPAKLIRTEGGGQIESVIIGEGSILSNVHGRSVIISPRVYVERTYLENVIVFDGSNIQNCSIKNTIIDKEVNLFNMYIGYDDEMDRKRGIFVDSESGIRVIPKGYDFTTQWYDGMA